jgi:hypothetical protein
MVCRALFEVVKLTSVSFGCDGNWLMQVCTEVAGSVRAGSAALAVAVGVAGGAVLGVAVGVAAGAVVGLAVGVAGGAELRVATGCAEVGVLAGPLA